MFEVVKLMAMKDMGPQQNQIQALRGLWANRIHIFIIYVSSSPQCL